MNTVRFSALVLVVMFFPAIGFANEDGELIAEEPVKEEEIKPRVLKADTLTDRQNGYDARGIVDKFFGDQRRLLGPLGQLLEQEREPLEKGCPSRLDFLGFSTDPNRNFWNGKRTREKSDFMSASLCIYDFPVKIKPSVRRKGLWITIPFPWQVEKRKSQESRDF